ncbi:hypothetical protein D4764_07G0011080 [Takifugu flavidus]|uniref:Uncharacterized protein n=1 Tax=Takifugu flavidus TaxID=433684 RepID=A0A5C6MUC8_9TELE|nr:hypothetical protein D4764_07G0011080 [Takifugu flavidus]
MGELCWWFCCGAGGSAAVLVVLLLRCWWFCCGPVGAFFQMNAETYGASGQNPLCMDESCSILQAGADDGDDDDDDDDDEVLILPEGEKGRT